MDYMGSHFPADPEQEKQYKEWYVPLNDIKPRWKETEHLSSRLRDILPGLVASGKFKSNPLLIRAGGLNRIQEDLDLLKSGTVSLCCFCFYFYPRLGAHSRLFACQVSARKIVVYL